MMPRSSVQPHSSRAHKERLLQKFYIKLIMLLHPLVRLLGIKKGGLKAMPEIQQDHEYSQISSSAQHYTGNKQCICCGHTKLEMTCQECDEPACAGWYGNCCC